MALFAPRKLAAAVLICRAMAILAEAAALTYCLVAADVPFSSLIFLKMALSVHLALSVVHLVYDVAQVFMLQPPPANRRLIATLVGSEWIMLQILFAAGMSSAGVLGYLDKRLGKCPFLPPHFCAQYTAAVVLTVAAWAVNALIAFMMACLGASWDIAATAAAAAAAAEAAAVEA